MPPEVNTVAPTMGTPSQQRPQPEAPARPRPRAHPPTPGNGNTGPNNQPNSEPNNTRKSSTSIRIASLNINGATAPSENTSFLEKWNKINHTIQTERIAVLAIQESHLDEEMTTTLQTRYEKNLKIIVSAHPTRPRAKAGIAFILNKKLLNPEEIKQYELIPGKVLMLNIKWLGTCNMPILNVYAPNDRNAHVEFWAKILLERRSRHAPIPDFMLGDFNVMEDAIDRMPPRLNTEKAIMALRDLRHEWGISDAWRQMNPSELAFTYRAQTASGET